MGIFSELSAYLGELIHIVLINASYFEAWIYFFIEAHTPRGKRK